MCPLVVLLIHSFDTTDQAVLGPSNAKLIGDGRRPASYSVFPGLTACCPQMADDLSPPPSNIH